MIFRLIPSTVVPVDIKPGDCPNALAISPDHTTKGLVSVAIAGTGELDVATVVPESVTLAGVAPVRWSTEDAATPLPEATGGYCPCHGLGGDGILDLVFKFRVADLEEMLNHNPPGGLPPGVLPIVGLTIPLKLEGQTVDGKSFEGEDCVLIRLRGDANSDSRLDISDAIEMLKALYLEQGGTIDTETLDVNGDEVVDVADVTWLLERIF